MIPLQSQSQILCTKRHPRATHCWQVNADACTAVRDGDNVSLSVRDEVWAFLAELNREFGDTFLDTLLVNKDSAVVSIAAKVLLTQKILPIESPDSVRFRDHPGNPFWWRGEAHLVAETLDGVVSARGRPWLHPLRAALNLARSMAVAAGQLLRSGKSLLGMRQTLGYWELPRSAPENGKPGIDVWWVAPRTTSFAWINDFLRVAGGRPEIRSFRITHSTAPSTEARRRLGLAWRPIAISRLRLWSISIKGVFSRLRELRRTLASHGDSGAGKFCRRLRAYWTACVLGSAADVVWESLFARIVSQDAPVLAIFTHAHNPGVTAFLRATRSRANVRTVLLQHGVNPSAYYLPRCDDYWMLTSQDQAYAKFFARDPSHVLLVNRLGPMAAAASQSAPNETARPTILFMNQCVVPKVLLADHIVSRLERVACLAERLGWQLIVRQHPGEARTPGMERFEAAHPAVTISHNECSLREHLEKIKPAVVMSFFSTGVLEAIDFNCLPVLLQMELEWYVQRINFNYDSFGIVIRSDDALEGELTRVLGDPQYRRRELARVRENYQRQAKAECSDLADLYAKELQSLAARL